MIHFKEFTLDNGLRCIVHEDFSTPMAALNVRYDMASSHLISSGSTMSGGGRGAPP